MTRAALIVLAAAFATMAAGFYVLRANEVLAPTLWPFWFALAAALVLALAAHPGFRLAILAGGVAFLAPLTRVAGIVANLDDPDRYVSPLGSALVGMPLWLTFAGVVLLAFHETVVPWARQTAAWRNGRRRRRRRAG